MCANSPESLEADVLRLHKPQEVSFHHSPWMRFGKTDNKDKHHRNHAQLVCTIAPCWSIFCWEGMNIKSGELPASEFWDANYTGLWMVGGVCEPQSQGQLCQPSASLASEMFAGSECGNPTGCEVLRHPPGISDAL